VQGGGARATEWRRTNAPEKFKFHLLTKVGTWFRTVVSPRGRSKRKGFTATRKGGNKCGAGENDPASKGGG